MRTNNRLIVLERAIEAVTLLRPVVERIRQRDRSLADQIRRAASSIVLNVGEGAYSDPGNRRARLHTACGSANETRVALRVAAAWGYLEITSVNAVTAKLDEVVAMLWQWKGQ